MSDDTDKPATPVRAPAPATAAKPPAPPVLVDSLDSAPVVFGIADLAITPGLNIVDAKTWAAASQHPPVAERIKENTLVADLDVSALAFADLLDLISRTTSRAGLEMLSEIESNKPLIAGPSRRRNPMVMEALRRKIAKLPAPKVQKAG